MDRDLGLAFVDRRGDEAVDLPLIDQLDRAAGIGALGEDHRHQFRTMLLESADQGDDGVVANTRVGNHHADCLTFAIDRKSTRLNSSHYCAPSMPSSA